MIQIRRASALLLSFFMMSMLILVSLGVSYLVIQDLSTMRTVVGGVQAHYAAEGMTEIGLQIVKENLPGYEVELAEQEAYFDLTNSELELIARSNRVPCEGQTEEEWMRLGQNESIQLPLFVQEDETGDLVNPANHFSVHFYIGDKDGNGIVSHSGIDVLRWKVIGFIVDSTTTEAMSEFIPLDPEFNSSAETPTRFGTYEVEKDEYSKGKYTTRGVFHANYPILSFMELHEYNYIVLTNVIEDDEFYIYYQMHSDDENLACPYVQVDGVANNEFGEARQSLTTYMREGENLPAYDFVLYNTDNDETPDDDQDEEESSEPWSGSVWNHTLPWTVVPLEL